MKQVEVTILGQSYILGCPDDGEPALLQAVAMVDREMSGIRDAGRVKARERIAVLAALNLAYRLAEAAATAAAPPESPLPSAPASTPNDEGNSGPAIAALMRRIDEVLAEDGRLL